MSSGFKRLNRILTEARENNSRILERKCNSKLIKALRAIETANEEPIICKIEENEEMEIVSSKPVQPIDTPEEDLMADEILRNYYLALYSPEPSLSPSPFVYRPTEIRPRYSTTHTNSWRVNVDTFYPQNRITQRNLKGHLRYLYSGFPAETRDAVRDSDIISMRRFYVIATNGKVAITQTDLPPNPDGSPSMNRKIYFKPLDSLSEFNSPEMDDPVFQDSMLAYMHQYQIADVWEFTVSISGLIGWINEIPTYSGRRLNTLFAARADFDGVFIRIVMDAQVHIINVRRIHLVFIHLWFHNILPTSIATLRNIRSPEVIEAINSLPTKWRKINNVGGHIACFRQVLMMRAFRTWKLRAFDRDACFVRVAHQLQHDYNSWTAKTPKYSFSSWGADGFTIWSAVNAIYQFSINLLPTFDNIKTVIRLFQGELRRQVNFRPTNEVIAPIVAELDMQLIDIYACFKRKNRAQLTDFFLSFADYFDSFCVSGFRIYDMHKAKASMLRFFEVVMVGDWPQTMECLRELRKYWVYVLSFVMMQRRMSGKGTIRFGEPKGVMRMFTWLLGGVASHCAGEWGRHYWSGVDICDRLTTPPPSSSSESSNSDDPSSSNADVGEVDPILIPDSEDVDDWSTEFGVVLPIDFDAFLNEDSSVDV